ncbi:hypothetical protein EVG20_g7999 [Dentipellis fragilis]|uniref:Peptidase S1 domain-containing protein n=1 Tax=Dentipellis fragilis TaxID=205917 RepID=A0A4Y9Y8J6_9AGAM|nr:hypothetical protein EVG20_g7999 [Dentipellis fragilis]
MGVNDRMVTSDAPALAPRHNRHARHRRTRIRRSDPHPTRATPARLPRRARLAADARTERSMNVSMNCRSSRPRALRGTIDATRPSADLLIMGETCTASEEPAMHDEDGWHQKSPHARPRLIATTNPFGEPTGPEPYTVLKELGVLGDHPLASLWDQAISDDLRRGLNTMGVNWTSIDAVRIARAGESSNLAVVWIGVEPGTLSFEEGSTAAHQCRMFVDRYKIPDYHVEIRESRVVRQAGNRFLDPVPSSDATFAARGPFTALLGIPLSAKRSLSKGGTGGFFLSAGGDDKNIYVVTARHVLFPFGDGTDENQEYQRITSTACTGQKRDDVVALGTSIFDEKLVSIESVVVKKELEGGVQEDITALRNLHHEIATQWATADRRVIGEVFWSPPISFSTDPGKYTLDLAVIKIDAGKLDNGNYRGNCINFGKKYSKEQLMQKVYINPSNKVSFKVHDGGFMRLRDHVPESALVDPPTRDERDDKCLIVFKNGSKSGLTFGKAEHITSVTRQCSFGVYHESREWPVIPSYPILPVDKHSLAFSYKGDSGSCVADVFGRIGGIITSGTYNPNTSALADVTYVTPITFIMKTLHGTKHFKHAHLSPILA